MPLFNLPPLSEKQTDLQSIPAGQWGYVTNLANLAKQINVGTHGFRDDLEPVRATPDAWAQARMFGELILRAADHYELKAKGGNVEKLTAFEQRTKSAISRWRGLLALFALAGFYDRVYKIQPSAEPIDLTKNSRFGKIFGELLPEIGNNKDLWHNVHTFSISYNDGKKNDIFAMSNPICMASLGRTSHKMNIDGIHWVNGDIKDPLSLEGEFALPITARAILAAWLEFAANQLDGASNSPEGKLRTMLREYANECGSLPKNSPFTIRMPTANIANIFDVLMLKPEMRNKADFKKWQSSATLVELKNGLFTRNLKGFILVDNAIAVALKKSPSEIFVWGSITLRDLLDAPAKLEAVRKEAAEDGYYIITADDIFTKRAARIPESFIARGNPEGFDNMIMPFRPITLLMPDLEHRVHADYGVNSVNISLYVDIGDIEAPSSNRVVLSRSYYEEPKDGQFALIEWTQPNSVTSIWPNFKASDWQHYVARLTYNSKTENGILLPRNDMPRPMRALSLEMLMAMEANGIDNATSIEKLRNINGEEGRKISRFPDISSNFPPINDEFKIDVVSNNNLYDCLQLSKYPMDTIFYVHGGASNKDSDGPKVPVAEIGFIKIALEELPNVNKERKEKIALDFGTTNTVACIGIKGDPVTFLERTVFPVEYRETSRAKQSRSMRTTRVALSQFYPAENRKTPTPTVLTPRNLDSTNSAFRNLIYFHWTNDGAEGDIDEIKAYRDIAETKKFNLKWENSGNNNALDFLEQFMIMISAEVRAGPNPPVFSNVEWRFSVPEAMHQDDKIAFRDNLHKILKERLGFDNVDKAENRALHSEGMAAANYLFNADALGHEQLVADSLNMILDIGGGTTDVTMWAEKEFVWRGSFRLAGRNFFTDYLTAHPEIFEQIGLRNWADFFKAKALYDKDGNMPSSKYFEDLPHMAEMLFSSETLKKQMNKEEKVINANNSDGEGLRLSSLIFIAGMAWYLGRIAKYFKDINPAVAKKIHSPLFAFCGRGSGMFKMMHKGGAEAETKVTNSLAVFSESADLIEDGMMPRPQFKRIGNDGEEKLEVARGMLIDNREINTSIKTERVMMARNQGEKPKLEVKMSEATILGLGLEFADGTKLAADAIIDFDFPKIEVESVDLTELMTFIDSLEYCANIKINLMPDYKQGPAGRIKQIVKDKLNRELRNSNRDKDLPEPPFITALRALIFEHCQREGKDNPLSISFIR